MRKREREEREGGRVRKMKRERGRAKEIKALSK